MKKLYIILLGCFLLTSCGKTTTEVLMEGRVKSVTYLQPGFDAVAKTVVTFADGRTAVVPHHINVPTKYVQIIKYSGHIFEICNFTSIRGIPEPEERE